ncbi:MAG: DUF4835 family protein [Tannerellaceae bacterium]|jgi:hypothetical protein|nr:DUF4835 family protein [Tannerellaceae bacterium]
MSALHKILHISLLLLTTLYGAKAQEINARVTVNSDKIQGTNKQVFTSLQTALTDFINSRRWTDATFSANERIECTFTLIINEHSDNNFKAEIQVQARRPVYNSGYSTTTLNFQDRQLDFDYVEFAPLDYTDNTLESNLTATVVYYIYVVLGFDFDSFSLKGGGGFFEQAQQIVNLAQSQPSWNGWKAFDSDRNRHALVTALTEGASDTFRQMWYDYHRRGLDEMAANADRGRTTIIESLPALEELKKARPTSVLLQMFSDSKLDELIAIYSKANAQDKQAGLKMLSNLFPMASTRLEALNK